MNHYHASELRRRDADLATPFSVDIGAAGQSVWQCQAVLRWLPGKRLVMALCRGDQRVLCKLFFSSRDYRRELRGYRALAQHQIATPALLDHAVLPGGGSVIRYEFIAAPTLEEVNSATPLTARSPALLHTVAAVAAMHRQGLRQVDIHPGNFLVQHERVYVIDSAAVTTHRAPLRGRLARDNLATLLAQFETGQIDALEPIWQHYCRHWPAAPDWQREQLAAAVERMHKRRWRHYRAKLTRSCTEFGCRKGPRRFEVWRSDRDSAALQAMLRRPEACMATGTALKRGNTATVDRVQLDGGELIIKRYNIKHWRHLLSRCWRPSRGWRSWHNAHYLLFNGLRTPQPVALIEERWGPLRGRAFFICDFAHGQDLKTYLQQASPAQRSDTLRTFAAIIARYYRAGISHGDMKANNFIVTDAGVTIIDLDPMRAHRRRAALEKALRRDIERFLQNFEGPLRAQLAAVLLPLLPAPLQRGPSRH